jgi:hypothetical protein
MPLKKTYLCVRRIALQISSREEETDPQRIPSDPVLMTDRICPSAASALLCSRHERPRRTNPTETIAYHLRSQVITRSIASAATQRNAAGDPDSQWHRCNSTNAARENPTAMGHWHPTNYSAMPTSFITQQIDPPKRTGAALSSPARRSLEVAARAARRRGSARLVRPGHQ